MDGNFCLSRNQLIQKYNKPVSIYRRQCDIEALLQNWNDPNPLLTTLIAFSEKQDFNTKVMFLNI